MAGFFDAVLREQPKGPLLAGWVIEGPSAGARALMNLEGGLLYRDDAFPAGLDLSRPGLVETDVGRVFVERITGEKRLVVCGAGHVALQVIRLGAALGYSVTAIEERAEFAEKAQTAGAGEVLRRPFGEVLDGLDGGPLTAFVVMTREHVFDVECIRRILKKPCFYMGVMGSRSRTAHIRTQLLEEGFDPERVAALHMPIGLSIGARTPEEIAVSVMAELIQAASTLEMGEGFPPELPAEAARIENGSDGGVLAMIVEKRGEAPRRPGAKMLVRADGKTFGTIGGGYAEAEILRAAGEMLREGRRECRIIQIGMKSGVMYCGGDIDVLLLPL